MLSTKVHVSGSVLISIRQGRIHITMLKNLFQVRAYAYVRNVVGNTRKSMRNARWNDDNVARPYFTTRESCHGAAAGWAIQNCRDFIVWPGSCSIDNGPPSDERCGSRCNVISLCRVVVEDTRRTLRARSTLAAHFRGALRGRDTGAYITAACALVTNRLTSRLGPMVNHGDAQLIASEINHSDRVIGNRALRIGRTLQHCINVRGTDIHNPFWLSRSNHRSCREY